MSSVLGEGTVAAPSAEPTGEPQVAPTGEPSGEPTVIETPTASFPENWKDMLSEDIRNDPAMGVIKDVEGLAKTYIHSQKQLGADKITVPNKYSTDEEWRGVLNKLGLPESLDKYEVQAKEEKLDTDFFKDFKQQAFELGVLPKQAQAMLDWYSSKVLSTEEEFANQEASRREKEINALKEEWGESFETNVGAAVAAVNEFGGQELKDYFNKTGIGDDPLVIKAFAKIGKAMSEDKFVDTQGDHITTGLSKEDYLDKIKEIQGNKEHPYWDKKHPEHRRAVEEMSGYFQRAYS